MARRREMVAIGGILPAGCRRVEYIESHGHEWIITDIQYTTNYGKVVADIYAASAIVDKSVWNSQRIDGTDTNWGMNNWRDSSGMVFYVGTTGEILSIPHSSYVGFRTKFTVFANNGVFTRTYKNSSYESTATASYSGSIIGLPVALFAGYKGTVITNYRASSVRAYGFEISNATRTMKLIPIVRKLNGTEEAGLYDMNSKRLFFNLGSGAFTWGELSESANGGGYKLKCPRRSYRRSSRPSARFCTLPRWEVAA